MEISSPTTSFPNCVTLKGFFGLTCEVIFPPKTVATRNTTITMIQTSCIENVYERLEKQ